MYRKRRSAHTKNKDKLKQNGASITKRRQTKEEKKVTNRRYKTAVNNKGSNERSISKRVTVPLEFFSQGEKLTCVSNKRNDSISVQESQNFLNGDVHTLFQTVSKTNTKHVQMLRRSKRISAQSPSAQTHYKSVTDYYVKLQSKQAPTEGSLEQSNTDKTKSNSILKEINYHFWKAVEQPKFSELSKNTQRFCDDNLLEETHLDVSSTCFCKNLEKQLNSVSLNSRKFKSIGRIRTLVSHIDAIVDGKENAIPMHSKPKIRSKPLEQENVVPSSLIPKFRWSYETPPTQKLKRPAASSSTELKPCILHTADDNSKILMELNVNANLSLLPPAPFDAFTTHFCTRNNSAFNGLSCNGGQANVVPFYNSDVPLFNTVVKFPQMGNENCLFDHCLTKPTTIAKQFHFGETSKQQIASISWQKEQENVPFNGFSDICNPSSNDIPVHLYRAQLPCTITSETFKLGNPNASEESCQFDQDLIIDEQLLFPSLPEQNEPSPLKFFPRKTYDV